MIELGLLRMKDDSLRGLVRGLCDSYPDTVLTTLNRDAPSPLQPLQYRPSPLNPASDATTATARCPTDVKETYELATLMVFPLS